MIATLKPLYELCASDLMTRELTVLSLQMSLREAASLLILSRSTGAPVVDGTGRCVGVLSASDFLRRASKNNNPRVPHDSHNCLEPNSVLTDWQMVELEKLPVEDVCHFMTPDPVTAGPETPIRSLARMMIDSHVHRVIIIDEEQQPIGIVSSSDLLAQLAYHDESTS
jgi:CBS domain-containing protein